MNLFSSVNHFFGQEHFDQTNFFCREHLQEESIALILKTTGRFSNRGGLMAVRYKPGKPGRTVQTQEPGTNPGRGTNPKAGVVKTGDLATHCERDPGQSGRGLPPKRGIFG